MLILKLLEYLKKEFRRNIRITFILSINLKKKQYVCNCNMQLPLNEKINKLKCCLVKLVKYIKWIWLISFYRFVAYLYVLTWTERRLRSFQNILNIFQCLLYFGSGTTFNQFTSTSIQAQGTWQINCIAVLNCLATNKMKIFLIENEQYFPI